MHDITPHIPQDRMIVQSYNAQGFMISGTRHVGPTIISPDKAIAWATHDPLVNTLALLLPVLGDCEFLLVGTGKTMLRVPDKTLVALYEHVAGVDFMTSKAACHTYNIALSEGRRVVAAVMPIDFTGAP